MKQTTEVEIKLIKIAFVVLMKTFEKFKNNIFV